MLCWLCLIICSKIVSWFASLMDRKNNLIFSKKRKAKKLTCIKLFLSAAWGPANLRRFETQTEEVLKPPWSCFFKTDFILFLVNLFSRFKVVLLLCSCYVRELALGAGARNAPKRDCVLWKSKAQKSLWFMK